MLNKYERPRRYNSTAVVLPKKDENEYAESVALPMPTSPMDHPVERFSEALARREDNRRALLKWIQGNLQAGIDFGQIHVVKKEKCRLARAGRAHECIDPRHWSKPSLWKPGAEKICGMLGLIPRFPNLSEYENAVLDGKERKAIILKCELHTGSGFVAAEGTGARRVAQDNGDINKSLKMAEKSAHIDATLRVAGLSELFTQDIEDMTGDARENIQPDARKQTPSPQSEKPHPQQKSDSHPPADRNGNTRQGSGSDQQKQRSTSGNGNGGNRITGKQYKFIIDLMKEAGMTKRESCLYAHTCGK